MTISRTNCLRGFGPEFLSGRHSSVRRREPAARRAESFGAPGVPGARRQAPGPPCGGGSPRFILLAKRHPDGQGRHELILAWPIKTAGSRPRAATSFCPATKGRKNALRLAAGMALSTARRLRSSFLPGRTSAPPFPPLAGPIPLGPAADNTLHHSSEGGSFSIRNASGLDRHLPTPRAVAAGAGWMNADQQGELSERSEFSPCRREFRGQHT